MCTGKFDYRRIIVNIYVVVVVENFHVLPMDLVNRTTSIVHYRTIIAATIADATVKCFRSVEQKSIGTLYRCVRTLMFMAIGQLAFQCEITFATVTVLTIRNVIVFDVMLTTVMMMMRRHTATAAAAATVTVQYVGHGRFDETTVRTHGVTVAGR